MLENTLCNFKVSKAAPTNNHTLQLLIYHLIGIHSVHIELEQIKNLGIFNPGLNKVYLLPISTIFDEINNVIIGY